MAIVKCRECGKDVSSQAESCPHCGVKAPAPRKANPGGRLILGVIVVIGLFVIVSSLKPSNAPLPSGGATSAAQPYDPAAKKALEEADAEKRAKFAAEREAIIDKVKRLNAAGKFGEILDIGNDYAWANDAELEKHVDFAREKLSDAAMRKAKAERKHQGVSIGMSAQDVLDSSWGRPESVNRTTGTYGVHEQWVYPGHHNYLYFQDGVLTSIQN